MLNANRAADGSFAAWLRSTPLFAFHPVKIPAEARKIQLRLSGVTGNGKLELLQNDVSVAEFEIVSGSEKVVSRKKVALIQGVPVIFKASGNWQGRLLDWQFVEKEK